MLKMEARPLREIRYYCCSTRPSWVGIDRKACLVWFGLVWLRGLTNTLEVLFHGLTA